ncbi:MAG: TIGR00725 family protein [Proteobacteria bacterium]|nr:TIGR00725 family protein [Pseudomonadota bacterium]
MSKISVARKPFIVGVMGSHKNNHAAMKDACRLGEEIAKRGHVLLTGGGRGVMKAASEGAHMAGGLVIAILPSERKLPLEGYPNEFVDIPIYTGMYDARNIITAKTPHVMIALSGGPGTLSEIAVALKSGTPVVGLNCPEFEVAGGGIFIRVKTVEEAMREVERILKFVKRKS